MRQDKGVILETIKKDILKIKQITEGVKRQYTTLGGDIEFVDVKNQEVRIRPTGYCWR
jgi:hypothetical protein